MCALSGLCNQSNVLKAYAIRAGFSRPSISLLSISPHKRMVMGSIPTGGTQHYLLMVTVLFPKLVILMLPYITTNIETQNMFNI